MVFDLDGTLNRTDAYAVPAHMEAMEHFGSPKELIDPDFIRSTFGMRWQEYTKLLLPGRDEQEVRQYLNMVARKEDEYMKTKGSTFDGVPEMLDSLHSMGCKTAVCSNASLRYISSVLKAIKIDDSIDYVQELVAGLTKEDTLRLLLEKTQPQQAVMVGDRIFDIKAARANELPSIGCLYGFCREEAQTADYAVESVSEIVPIIERIFA